SAGSREVPGGLSATRGLCSDCPGELRLRHAFPTRRSSDLMLELSMDMEAELGIDSIKRVEILAAVQEQAPGLPEIDAGHMGTLRDREGTGLNSSRLQGP